MKRRGRISTPLLGAAVLLGGCVEPSQVERRWEAFGEQVFAEVHSTVERDAGRVLDDVEEAIRKAEGWVRPGDGLLERINEVASTDYYHFPEEERDLYRCVLLALDWAKASRGAFDPTVGPFTRLWSRGSSARPSVEELEGVLPGVGWEMVNVAVEARAIHFRDPDMALDLGGVAKGCALDLASRAFSRAGTQAGLLQIGGNLYTWGEPARGRPWSVKVPDPRQAGRELVRISRTNRGVAVSGHRDPSVAGPFRVPVLNPETGRPVGGSLLAAVAVASSGADADALSTALFSIGFHGAAEFLGRTNRVEAVLLVQDDGAPYFVASASLEGHLEFPPDIADETGERVRYLLPPRTVELPL